MVGRDFRALAPLEVPQPVLIVEPQLPVRVHHGLVEAQARGAAAPVAVHLSPIEVGVARVEHPALRGVKRDPGVTRGMAGQGDHEDFRREPVEGPDAVEAEPGFAAAGVGMLFGVVQFWLTKQHLGDAGRLPSSSGNAETDATMRRKGWLAVAAGLSIITVIGVLAISGVVELDPLAISRQTTYLIAAMAVLYFAYLLFFAGLDSIERKRVIVLVVLFIASAMFWSGFEQAGSSLNLFADRYTVLEFESFTLLSTWFQSLNSTFIIIFAPVFAWMWVWLAKRNLNPSTPAKFGIGLVFLAIGFLVMVGASMIVADGGQALPTWLLFTYLFHTLGELALSPVGLSATTKLAPKRFVGQMMGVWFLAMSLGNLIAGQIAGDFDANDLQAFPAQYMQIVLTAGGTGLILLLFTKPIKKLMGGID